MGKRFHIAGQVVSAVAQIMMGPTATLFRWSPELVTFMHAAVGAIQAVMGIMAVYFDPNKKSED